MPWAITPGYVGDPEATERAWRNGWFHSGDVFVRDAKANYAIVGRVKDSIRRRGENVSAAEVEREVSLTRRVAEAAVVGVEAEVEQEVYGIPGPPARGRRPGGSDRFLATACPTSRFPATSTSSSRIERDVALRPDKNLLRERGVRPQAWDREAAGIKLKRERLA